MNAIYRIANALVAATFASALGYAVYSKATELTGSLDDVSLAAGGVVLFVGFIVVSWLSIDRINPRVG